ncbi:class I SAM-dependent methyltransferase [Candidatus Uhrbacteria bacterium]|nr:class I SAM-dependent methyltransferase [Candidatus Uhrbacteria bacterium]
METTTATCPHGYGDFGAFSTAYNTGRQGYPQEVIELFWLLVKDLPSRVLDIGCGTGISTRQLAARGGEIIGCDPDEEMLNVAKSYQGYNIEYIQARAEKIPFENEVFDAVTAFGAFHWFYNAQAISEIRRVLKHGGLFFVVNKNDRAEFKKDYRDIVCNVVENIPPHVKALYDPQEILVQAGFTEVHRRGFDHKEYFTMAQALQYFQSTSLWGIVPEHRREGTKQKIEECYGTKMIGGILTRPLEVSVIYGYNGFD